MGIVEGIKLLKEAVMIEADLISPGGAKKAPAGKAPPAKGKGAVEPTAVVAEPIPPRNKSMLAGVIRIIPGPVVEGTVVPDTPPPVAQVEGGEDSPPPEPLLRKFIAHFVSPVTTNSVNRGSFAPTGGASSDPPSALPPGVVSTPDDVLVGVCAGFRLPIVFFRTNTLNGSVNTVSPSPLNPALDTTTAVTAAGTTTAATTTAETGIISSSSVPRKPPAAVLNKGLSTTEGLMTAILLANPHYCAKFASKGVSGGGGGKGGNGQDLDQLEAGVEERKEVLSREGSGVGMGIENGVSPSLPGTAPDNAKGQGLGPAEVYLGQVMTDYQSLSSSRRERLLSIDARLWLLHVSQSNPLNFDDVLRVRGMFSAARASYIELFGTLLMAYGVQVAEILEKMRVLEAEMIGNVKAPDARWQFVCQMTQEKLSSLSSTSGHTKEQVTPLVLPIYINPCPPQAYPSPHPPTHTCPKLPGYIYSTPSPPTSPHSNTFLYPLPFILYPLPFVLCPLPY